MMKFLVLVAIGVIAAQECFDRSGTRNCVSWQNEHKFCERSYSKTYCNKTCGGCGSTGGSGGNGGSTSSCGVSKVTQGRVVNGVNAQPGAWPWIVSLQKGTFHFCGATLLTPKWVLTAGHCVGSMTTDKLDRFTVNLGVQNRGSGESSHQRIKIKRVIKHPKYRGVTNDVTLIELATPAKLNDRVAQACLPKQGAWPQVGKQCYIAGWGTTNHPGNSPITLQQAKLPIVERGHRGCHNNNNVVCVGLGFGKQPDGKQHPNACRGDSGGPLVCQLSDGRWQLEGVASYVYTYCKYYTAYASVNQYVEWINSYIK